MMYHARYRFATLADPRDPDAELRAHRESCAECRTFTEQLLRFESRLERALRVDVPAGADVLPFARKAATATPGRPRRWMAIAASVLLGVAVAGVFGLHCRSEALPPMWSRTWRENPMRGGAPTSRCRASSWMPCCRTRSCT